MDAITEIRDRFEKAYEYEAENHRQFVEDIRFANSQQWPDDVERKRKNEERPCLTINRLPAFISQVVNDSRRNSPTIQVHPIDDETDPQLAEVYEGLIRQIEQSSNADQAYDNALEQAVTGGIGGFRILTKYSDDDSFNQEIYIKRVTNPTTFLFDPLAKEYAKTDANYAFVSEWVSKEEFKSRFKGKDPVNWESSYDELDELWVNDERVRIAEYWEKKPTKKKLALLETGETVCIDDVEVRDQGGIKYIVSEIGPIPIVRIREVKSHKILRSLVSGKEVLEGPEEWAGRYIPIIPVYGPEVHIQGKTEYRSLIRYTKDAQRQYNYWQSTITEKIALAPRSPFLVTPAQIKGLDRYWKKANTSNLAYLPYNPDGQAPPPERQSPAAVNAAELQQSAQAIDDMKATMGMFDASLGNMSNETSGRAILARQAEGDTATFGWIDNLSRSINQAGKVLVDLIPKIYDTERVVRILGNDDSAEYIRINTVVRDGNGNPVKLNDISAGKFDVTISTGPSYQTQRIEAAESLIRFVQAVPQAGQVAMDLIAKNMDWPGSDELAKRLKKILPPGILDPDDENAQQPPPPNPEDILSMKKKEVDIEGKELDNVDKKLDLSERTGELEEMVRQMVIQAVSEISLPVGVTG